jgi:transcriptional regulator with XRE-family HTH domain
MTDPNQLSDAIPALPAPSKAQPRRHRARSPMPCGSRAASGPRTPSRGAGTAVASRRNGATGAAAGPSRLRADPAPVRAHLAQLRQEGGTYEAIAVAAGLSAMTVHALLHRDGRIRPEVAAAVLAVSSPDLRRTRVDAGGTRLRLRALQVMGHGSARVARATGASEQALQKLARGDTRAVTPQLRDTIARIYDAWWDKRAPERTRHERAAAAAARRRAIRGNWCAGAGLDDDQLDIPGYQPACGWRPARGTGIASPSIQARRGDRTQSPEYRQEAAQ